MANKFDALRASIKKATPAADSPGLRGKQDQVKAGSTPFQRMRDELNKFDPDVDPSGIPSNALRAGLSRADTPEESELFLTEKLGKDGWTKDKYGQFAVTPKGKEILGLEPGDKPTVIDRPMLQGIEVGDFADMAGTLPVVGGGIAGGLAATGLGVLPAMGVAAITAAGAKGFDESIEALQGRNLQSPKEVAVDLAKEGGQVALGEGISRGVGFVGKRLIAPEAHRMTGQSRQLLKEAQEIGVTPAASTITKAPIQGTVAGMAKKVLGDPLEAKNAKALVKEVHRLRTGAGPKNLKVSLGDAIQADVKSAKAAFSEWARGAYKEIDDMVGGNAIYPTASLKATARDILESFPMSNGKRAFTESGLGKHLEDIMGLDDHITGQHLQTIRRFFGDSIDDTTLAPGVGSRYSAMLKNAATKGYDDAVEEGLAPEEAIKLLKATNARYAKEIQTFDDALITRINKRPGLANSLEPEMIADALFKKERSSALKRIMPMLSEETKSSLRRASIDKLFENITTRSTKGPLQAMFDGKRFLDGLDSYGDEALDAMFGKETRKELYRLGEVTHLLSATTDSGSIVAAAIAVRPWAHIGKLAQLGLLRSIMNSKTGLKYLTEGFELPKKAIKWKGKQLRYPTKTVVRDGVEKKVLGDEVALRTEDAMMFATRFITLMNAAHKDSTSGPPEPKNGSQ